MIVISSATIEFVFLFLVTVILLSSENKKRAVIPKESIRYRIIAESNSIENQKLKWEINSKLIPIITKITKNSNNINESRKIIKDNLNNIKKIVNKYTNDYDISFGQNYFPKKEYGDVLYSEGNYESLVITLGKGNGDNWWCVLFPPLCLIEAKKTDIDNITYSSYINEVINKYF